MEKLDCEQNRINPMGVGNGRQDPAPQKGACQFHGAKSFSDYGQTGGREEIVLPYYPFLTEQTVGGTCATKETENSRPILACLVDTQLLDNIINHLYYEKKRP